MPSKKTAASAASRSRAPEVDELADWKWLVSHPAEPWLDSAAASSLPLLRLTKSLRKELSANRVHLILEQVELRRRALAKFEAAGSMFFTRQGYEQATDQWTAAYKASRFPATWCVTDLCCGIGGDLLALADRSPCRGYDRHPVTALLAATNCERLQRNAQVSIGDIERDVDVAACEGWHIDPDRRGSGRRTSQLEFAQPSLETLERLLSRNDCGAVKLAPATDVPEAWQRSGQQEWISYRGQCKQQVVWFGDLARFPGQRVATLVKPHDSHQVVGHPDQPLPLVEKWGRYLFEPDAAVLAARLVGQLAAAHQLAAVASDVAYLTGDRPVSEPALETFQIRDVLPWNMRQLQQWLGRQQIGHLEIKKRGVDIDPNRLYGQLDLSGTEAAVLIIVGGRRRPVRAIMADRRAPEAAAGRRR